MRKILVSFLSILVTAIFATASSTATAQSKNIFSVGKPVFVQALYCFDKRDASFIATAEENGIPSQTALFVRNGQCVRIEGRAIYVKQIQKIGEWRVWEVKFDGVVVYEATNWRPDGEI